MRSKSSCRSDAFRMNLDDFTQNWQRSYLYNIVCICEYAQHPPRRLSRRSFGGVDARDVPRFYFYNNVTRRDACWPCYPAGVACSGENSVHTHTHTHNIHIHTQEHTHSFWTVSGKKNKKLHATK